MKPSIGRIVHIIKLTGEHLPAIVVAVNVDGSVNVQVFRNEMGMVFVPSVVEGQGAGAWHWPERVE
jgi:hypothetical protein